MTSFQEKMMKWAEPKLWECLQRQEGSRKDTYEACLGKIRRVPSSMSVADDRQPKSSNPSLSVPIFPPLPFLLPIPWKVPADASLRACSPTFWLGSQQSAAPASPCFQPIRWQMSSLSHGTFRESLPSLGGEETLPSEILLLLLHEARYLHKNIHRLS